MPKHERPKQIPEGMKEAADPNPDVEPHISDEPKGDPTSRIEASDEPGENEKQRRVVEKLREREHNS